MKTFEGGFFFGRSIHHARTGFRAQKQRRIALITRRRDPYPISETGERAVSGMELTPGHNSLEVEFRALHFDIGEGLRYQYRLEGADNDWSRPSDEQTVRYANLAPGKYRFTVRSITESGQTSAGQAVLAFEVLPVFWKRSWFLGIVTLAVASGALSLHRYRLNHLLALERIRIRLATDLHDDVGAGLAEIAIRSEVAKRQDSSGTLHCRASLDSRTGRPWCRSRTQPRWCPRSVATIRALRRRWRSSIRP